MLHQITHGESVVRSTAVVGNISELSIGGRNYLVRIRADGHPRDNFQTRWVDDCEYVVAFCKHQQCLRRSALRGKKAETQETTEHKCRNEFHVHEFHLHRNKHNDA